MVHFSKLKLYGFKSFVDKTELEIGTGLNGIVGPNGCGKSNLVEALRWVMGEKSAKNMRGGGMEDVIFAGTSKRPARSIAEVTVVMNNEDATAPAPFTSSTEIEINRRIERDKGSQYRVNGKAVRARDVNLLFADTATGASSPALVSQGRITEIITAKPSDRRKILEESAGISGLHSRRHEAELRLRAAETNLTRLDDSLNDMRSRLSSLKRQARQAERYKELSDNIRRLDMALIWSEWSETHAKIKQERTEFAIHNDTVQSALEISKSVSTKIETLESELPDLRKNHMEAQAVLQNFRVSLERLEQDIQTKTKGLQDAIEAKDQINQDSEFTQGQFDQILLTIESIKQELNDLDNSGQTLPDDITAAEHIVQTLQSTLDSYRQSKQDIETKIAVATQSKSTLDNQLQTAKGTRDKINQNITILKDAITDTQSKINAIQNDETLSIDLEKLSTDVENSKTTITNLSTQSSTANQNLQSLKVEKDDLNSILSGLEGELNGLRTLLENTSHSDADRPTGDDALLNHLKVTDGYEKAVSAALGQWISMAGLDDGASVYWSPSTIKIDCPHGTTPLLNYVDAPTSLHPVLNAIGVVDVMDNIELSVGQMIVTRDGAIKRWDGLNVKSSAAQSIDQTHIILEQKNRVADLETQITNKQNQLSRIDTDFETAQANCDTFNNDLTTAKDRLAEQERNFTNQSYAIERLRDQLSTLNEKLTDQTARLDQNKVEKNEIETQITSLQNQINDGDDTVIEGYETEIQALSDKIEIENNSLNDARNALNTLVQKQSTRTQNINRLQSDLTRLNDEQDKLSTRLDDFSNRADTIEAKILAYKTSTDDNTDDIREGLLSKIADQDKKLSTLADQLNQKDTLYKSLQLQLRDADSNAATARENRARVQANVANAEAELNRIQSDISDQFDLSPQRLEEQTYSLFDDNIPSIDDLHDQKETITRQRDGIGPVNLRAAIESQETEAQLAEMEGESNDLTKAIEQLRGGIAKLNREAKDRLAIAFTRVDTHFQRLFAQLFEGGKAHLKMIESDDPLEAGLEIYAEPPGKTLQKLSLLSGGEQTLTSIALIFAMFLTNPSPICVLDEIDAPLDDANVDRVCTLMENIARETDTRFIVITHHRMTMARMDRLYGVTMSERGVSQLVSVDMALQAELELSETA